MQHSICRLTGNGYSIARHADCAMAVTLQQLDLPGLETDQHKGGMRRAEYLHPGKVASQDWQDALLRRGMQMRIDFVNDHDARLFG